MARSYRRLKITAIVAFCAGIGMMLWGFVNVNVYGVYDDKIQNLGFTLIGLGGTFFAVAISIMIEANRIKNG